MGSPNPFHAAFILVIVVAILAIPWFLPEDVESFLPSAHDLHPVVMLAPIVLLLLVRFLASAQGRGGKLGIETDASSIHRASGSSVGLAVVLVIVLAMIWYQSSFQETWGVASE